MTNVLSFSRWHFVFPSFSPAKLVEIKFVCGWPADDSVLSQKPPPPYEIQSIGKCNRLHRRVNMSVYDKYTDAVENLSLGSFSGVFLLLME